MGDKESGRQGDKEKRDARFSLSPPLRVSLSSSAARKIGQSKDSIMKAAYITKPGPPENIIVGDLPTPRADRQPGARARRCRGG